MANIDTYTFEALPKPLGNYSHAAGVGELLFVCGMGPRNASDDSVPGLQLDENGKRLSYDIRLETRATLENLKGVLEEAGTGLEQVVEMNVYLTDMKDFAAMNEVYATFFSTHAPVRTTLGVAGLPGNIAVEMKAVALRNHR